MSQGVKLTPRWAKPVIPIGTEPALGTFVYVRNGRVFTLQTKFWLKPDDAERVRLGYVCLNCLEPHERPYPEACAVCRFPMREVQDRMFELAYEGEEEIGPTEFSAEEWEAGDDEIRRRQWRRKGIWLPSEIHKGNGA